MQGVPANLRFSEVQNGTQCHADQPAIWRRKLLAMLWAIRLDALK
jgi:hypothetical protein